MNRTAVFLCMNFFLFKVAITYATLESENLTLGGKINSTERKLATYNRTIRQLRARREAVESGFQACSNPMWQIVFEPRRIKAEELRERLEEEHQKLNARNIDLESVRIELEKTRKRIEEKYREKGLPYEEEFRAYMDQMQSQYLKNIPTQLFQGYDRYIGGITKWLEIMELNNNTCRRRKFDKTVVTRIEERLLSITKFLPEN